MKRGMMTRGRGKGNIPEVPTGDFGMSYFSYRSGVVGLGSGIGKWLHADQDHHVVISWPSLNTPINLYVDGVRRSDDTVHANAGISGTYRSILQGHIGKSTPTTNYTTYRRNFTGYIDNAAVYNIALSDAQVAAHYANRYDQAAYSSLVATDGAIHHFKLDETSGTTAINEIGTNGTYSAGTKAQPAVMTGSAYSVYFNGVSKAYEISIPVAGVPQNPPYSLEAWIRLPPTATTGAIMSFGANLSAGEGHYWYIT